MYQSLLINATSNKADIAVLLDSCEDYMLNRRTAEDIVREVQNAVKEWKTVADSLQIAQREQDMFRDRFSINL